MKINLISKLQQGGAFIPPYAVYQPIPWASQRTAPTTTQQTDKSQSSKDLTDKDLLTMLNSLDGLPSDMAVITSQLQNFYVRNSTPGILGKPNSSNIALKYLGILNQLKVANFNKKEYDNAYNKVSSNGGINEFAINSRGQFVCMNEKGDFKLMSAEELKKSEDYVPLTNSELLYRRAQDVDLANNNQLLSVVQNGISMEVVTKQIQDAVGHIGSSENSQEGYTSIQGGRIVQGLQDFEKAVQEAAGNTVYNGTIDDLYKYKYLTKSQANQAAEAMAYIYNTLAPNAKALLKAKSDLTEAGAKRLIQALIASRLDNTQQFSLDLISGPTKEAQKSDKEKSEKDGTKLKATQLVEMTKSISGVGQALLIDRGDGIQMTAYGRKFNLVNDTNGKPIGDTSLANMLMQSGIQGIVKNMDNITFGDQKVSREALKNITYNNTGVMRVNLPINPDGSINFNLFEAFQKAEEQVAALGNRATANDVKRIFNNAGLSSLVKADGTLNESKFGAFLVTEGYTTDQLSGIKPSAFVKARDKDTDKSIELIKNSLKTGSGKNATTPDIDEFNWYSVSDWFGYYDKVYKAAVYIPIDNNTLLAASLDKQKLDYDEAMGLEAKYQEFNDNLSLDGE